MIHIYVGDFLFQLPKDIRLPDIDMRFEKESIIGWLDNFNKFIVIIIRDDGSLNFSSRINTTIRKGYQDNVSRGLSDIINIIYKVINNPNVV